MLSFLLSRKQPCNMDYKWLSYLHEVSAFQMLFQLRQLFPFIAIFQQPSNSSYSWNTFKDSLSTDYLQFQDQNQIYEYSLRDINEILKLHDFSLSAFNFPIIINSLIVDHNAYLPKNPNLDYNLRFQQANDQQFLIINEIITVIQQNNTQKDNVFFIDESGGTGKIFIYQCLIQKCLDLDRKVITVAWISIAVMLLENCHIIQTKIKLSLVLHENSVSSLTT